MPGHIIRGLKMSGPLALIRQEGLSQRECLRILEGLESLRINLAFAALVSSPSRCFQLSFCVDLKDSRPAYNHAAPIALRLGLNEPRISEPVVALDLYPRGKGLDFSLAVEAALLEAGITPVALGGSLSAVVAVVPQAQALAAARVLAKAFGLPGGLEHLQERVQVRQEP